MNNKRVFYFFIATLLLGPMKNIMASDILIPNDPSDNDFIITIDVEGHPFANLENPTQQADEHDTKLQATESNFAVFIPEIEVGLESVLRQKFDFGGIFVQYENFETMGAQELAHLYGMSYQGELVLPINETWMVRGRIRPGFFTDAEGSSSNNFKLQGGASVDRYIDTGMVGLGASYTNVFGRPLIIPTLSLVYRNNPLTIEAELPMSVAAWFQASDSTSWGLLTRIRGNEYGLNKPDTVYNGNDFEYSVWTIGPAVQYAMAEGSYLQLELGYTIDQKMRVNDHGTTQLDLTPENTWFIRGSIQFQP